jgi:hypothetical protein
MSECGGVARWIFGCSRDPKIAAGASRAAVERLEFIATLAIHIDFRDTNRELRTDTASRQITWNSLNMYW